MTRRSPSLKGHGVPGLRQQLLALCKADQWPILEPLPVTRFLGESFGISNVSAYRVLNELHDSGHLWRSATGRYYLPEARRLLEKPSPVGCLLRRLEKWTVVGQGIMQGVDHQCGVMDRAMLLVHDRVLFRQTAPSAPPAVGTCRELHQAMDDFLLIHAERISGVVLDELWPDHVLSAFEDRLKSGVVLYRRTALGFLGSVSADVDLAARTVIEHARKNGFEKLALLVPPGKYPPSEEMALAIRIAARGKFPRPPTLKFVAGLNATALIHSLSKHRKRVLVVATEDNLAADFLDATRAAGLDTPTSIGLLSTMGSRIAAERSITSVGFDFQLMGAKATEMAVGGKLKHITLAPRFLPGSTT